MRWIIRKYDIPKRMNFLIGVLSVLTVSSCSIGIQKLDIEYKKDFSGSVRGTFYVDKTKESQIAELKEVAATCNAIAKEVHSSDLYIIDYEFDNYKKLQRSVDCYGKLQKKVYFNPLVVSNNILTKEITFPLSFIETGDFTFDLDGGNVVPSVISITVPGKVVSASIDYSKGNKNPFSLYNYEISGNTVIFKAPSSSSPFEDKKKWYKAWSNGKAYYNKCTEEELKKAEKYNYDTAKIVCNGMKAMSEFKNKSCKEESNESECIQKLLEPYGKVKFSVTTRINRLDKFM